MSVTIHHGDNRDVLRSLPDNSIDSVVTDPPYALVSIQKRFGKPGAAPASGDIYARAASGFMSQTWDTGETAFAVEFWAEIWRVLKPGGHVVAFSGTRTYHRLACAVEDAGFEIRDMLSWLYGSGFPKSHDVSKGIDKAAGAARDVVGPRRFANGTSPRATAKNFGVGDLDARSPTHGMETAPATPDAQQWSGWGTALKPSQEPVIWATKPKPNQSEWVTIDHRISVIEDALWSMLSASTAEAISASSHPGRRGEFASAQWSAESALSTPEGLSDLTDMSPSDRATISSWSTVSSWRRTLAAIFFSASTFTTGTGSNTTIDWRTLNSCLSKITPESIIQAHKSGAWSIVDAGPAEALFGANAASWRATLELSVAVNAIAKEPRGFLDGADLSPANEPIVFARKPLDGTVAANVLAHGTGALNIDACRVGTETHVIKGGGGGAGTGWGEKREINEERTGRFPANVLHDGSDEVVGAFPDSAGQQGVVTGNEPSSPFANVYGDMPSRAGRAEPRGDTGSAARFFYAAKPDDLCGLCGCPSGVFSGKLSPCNANTAEPSSPTENTQIVATAPFDAAGSQPPVREVKNLASSGLATGAEPPSSRHRQADSDTAAGPAATPGLSSLAQNVKSAGSLCDSCATAIAQNLVAARRNPDPESLAFPASISERSAQILRQHLALYVEGRESTDTILTTPSLRQLLGSVFHAIAESTLTTEEKPSASSEKSKRLWYGSKADATDRLGSKHPTVKPTDLMRWLVRLVTPPGGTVLDPFAGSGSTGVACIAEGFDAILIEREAEYVADIRRRIAWANGEGKLTAQELGKKQETVEALPLFGGAA